MGGEITTAHVAIVLALAMPVLTVFLQRWLGVGAESRTEMATIREKVHALELAGMAAQTNTREHVAAQYATKGDITELKEQLRTYGDAQRQYHEALMTLLTPVANQLIGVSPVRR
jgi:hypothetical protein